jgi:putative PIN family toxin of toxin-antitoxin system
MGEENKKPRVAIDTNLVISGTISPHGYPAKFLTTWTQGSFEWILTEETFDEIIEVLSREELKNKYHIDVAEAQSFLDNLAVGAEFVTAMPHESLPIHSRDEKDDILLACAFGGNCDYLVTGDEDLLVLNGKKRIRANTNYKSSRVFAEKRGEIALFV